MGISYAVFEVMCILPVDRYQNATLKAMPLHELKKVQQLQKHFMVLTKDFIGHLKMFRYECFITMAFVSNGNATALRTGLKTLAFKYEFSLNV